MPKAKRKSVDSLLRVWLNEGEAREIHLDLIANGAFCAMGYNHLAERSLASGSGPTIESAIRRMLERAK